MVPMHDKAQGRIFLAGRRPGELAERLSQRLGISLSGEGGQHARRYVLPTLTPFRSFRRSRTPARLRGGVHQAVARCADDSPPQFCPGTSIVVGGVMVPGVALPFPPFRRGSTWGGTHTRPVTAPHSPTSRAPVTRVGGGRVSPPPAQNTVTT